jgi:hypothetical protein
LDLKTIFDLFNRCKTRVSVKLRHIPHSIIGSQHKKRCWCNYQVYANQLFPRLLFYFARFVFGLYLDFFLFLAREYAAIWRVVPRYHIVVDTKMVLNLHLASLIFLLDKTANEVRKLLNYFKECYRWLPFSLATRENMKQQVSAICQRGCAKLSLCVNQWGLERKFVAQ